MIERNRLIEALDKALDSHVERICSNFMIDGGATAEIHARHGLEQTMQTYETLVGIITQLTPNG